MPEKALRKNGVTVAKRIPVHISRCKLIKTKLMIHRSISMKELLGLKNIDSIEQRQRKKRICKQNARIEKKVLFCPAIYSTVSPGDSITKSSSAL